MNAVPFSPTHQSLLKAAASIIKTIAPSNFNGNDLLALPSIRWIILSPSLAIAVRNDPSPPKTDIQNQINQGKTCHERFNPKVRPSSLGCVNSGCKQILSSPPYKKSYPRLTVNDIIPLLKGKQEHVRGKLRTGVRFPRHVFQFR